jgi:hypothetical protein
MGATDALQFTGMTAALIHLISDFLKEQPDPDIHKLIRIGP